MNFDQAVSKVRIVSLALAFGGCAGGIHDARDGGDAQPSDVARADVATDAHGIDATTIDVPPAADVATRIDAVSDDVASDGATHDSGGVPQTRMLPGGPGHLTFDDEFDGTALDPMRWNRWYVYAATINNELQFYTPDAFDVGGGTVSIRGERRSMYGFSYTSGAMTTFGSFAQSYGYFEMSARIPAGNGLWPAFWLLSSDQSWPPEIDVLEVLGEAPSVAHMTYHWRDGAGMHLGDGSEYRGVDLSQDFHTYAVDWRPGSVVWYIDGVERKRHTGSDVTGNPMYILANLAIGGSWPVPPDSTTPFPAHYAIDYIRAYQYDAMPAGAVVYPHDYEMPIASTYTPAAGETVNIDARVRINTAQPGLILQAVLYDQSRQSTLANTNWMTATTLTPGEITHRFPITIPAGTAPGIYRLSIGLFHQDWSPVDWLGNAVVLTVH